MGGEDRSVGAEQLRQAIKALEETVRICHEYLRRMEAEERSAENVIEHMFFKTGVIAPLSGQFTREGTFPPIPALGAVDASEDSVLGY